MSKVLKVIVENYSYNLPSNEYAKYMVVSYNYLQFTIKQAGSFWTVHLRKDVKRVLSSL